jgi:hypothetical protein
MREASEAAVQMAARSGPYYERWLVMTREGFVRKLRELEEEMGVPEHLRTVAASTEEIAHTLAG